MNTLFQGQLQLDWISLSNALTKFNNEKIINIYNRPCSTDRLL
jgi:hypothetical protein